jgi:uncharacterized membrane protein YfcA
VIATSAGVAAVARPGRGADVSLAVKLEAVSIAGAISGGVLAGRVGHATLSVLFAVVVFATAAYLLHKARAARRLQLAEDLFRTDYTPRNWGWGFAGSGVAGVLSGLLGIGGGFIKVPLMYGVMEVPLGIATATSNFQVGITGAASVFVYYSRGDIRPLVVIPTALGVFVGALLGVQLLTRLRVSWLRLVLIGLLLLIGVRMLLSGLAGG